MESWVGKKCVKKIKWSNLTSSTTSKNSFTKLWLNKPGPSQAMKPMPYDLMDYESLINKGNLQEGTTEHALNKPWRNDFEFCFAIVVNFRSHQLVIYIQ
uniref:Uncharacterized protein n=1 Tax=Acrobeloides nanus TaxID=290746 RepID=A0A914C1S3_9BILA